MPYYRINVVVLAVLLAYVPIGDTSNAIVDKPQSFCLRHTGPQDKSLPKLCFVQKEAAGHSPPSEKYTLNVKTSETEAFRELVKSFDEPICLGKYGSYATIGLPEIVVCRKDMKKLLQTAKRFADPLTSELIDELYLRI